MQDTKGNNRMNRVLIAGVGLLALAFCAAGCGDGDADEVAVEIKNLAGVWRLTLSYVGDDVETRTINLSQTGQALTGSSYQSGYPQNSAPVTGTIDGSAVTLTENWDNGNSYTYIGIATSETSMGGSCESAVGGTSGTWTALKQ